jgi:hypothetical protein
MRIRMRALFGFVFILSAVVLIALNGIWQGAIAQNTVPPSPPILPSPSPSTSPDPSAPAIGAPIDPIPGSRTAPPIPTPSVTPSALPAPVPSLMPSLIIPNTAQPLPIAGKHTDPTKRFEIGLLQGYQVTPLGDSVLIESPDGRLAYTVLAQTAGQLGLLSGSVTLDNLAQIARNALQRGEGFQSEAPQSIVNGIQMNWTGQLTIGGRTQPVNGIIMAKPGNNSVLLLTIAATEAGAADLPGAIAALGESLQGL